MGKRVLLLFQDNPATQELVQAIAEQGHQASAFAGLRGVTDQVNASAPDLVLVSLDRSDVDGRDIARLLRKDPRCATVPIVICSQARDRDAARVQMMALGAQGLLRPEGGVGPLIRDIEDLLQRRRPLFPANEQARLNKLRSLAVLDSPPDAVLDEIVAAASAMAGAPIALVSLVDADRQWFKARVGLGASETARDLAFCAHAIHGQDVMEVPDSRKDGRFAQNPLVQGPPNVVFYAGAPLLTSDGLAMGTLCVIDHVPRQLSDGQRQALLHLGRAVTRLLEQGPRSALRAPLGVGSPPASRPSDLSSPRL